ncbi:MAG: hypothetical protein OHK0013_01420 [Sandaracinaceae bacterium]
MFCQTSRMRLLFILSALVGVGCTTRPNFEASCAGEDVLACRPFEYAQVVTASLEPARVSPGDPRVLPTVRVTLRTCGDRVPSVPRVQIAAIVSGGGGSFPLDAAGRDVGPPGDDSRVYQLGSVSATATTDIVVEQTIDNPFDARIPYDSDIQLRFAPVIGGCEGDALTIPYRTGPRPTL